jgi:lipopolysaccharide export LptBFGC system permease protein LptF
MTYATAGTIVVATGGIAAALTLVMRRNVQIDALRRHHEIGSAVFLQMGVVFAVLLAFVFNEVWGEYNQAAEAISRESGDLRVAALLSDNLPRDAQERLKSLIMAYVTSVIDDEWPAMAERQDSPVAEQRLRQLAFGVMRLPTSEPEYVQTRNEVSTLLRAAEENRQTRLFQMTAGVPAALWFILLAFSFTLVGFLFFFGIDNVISQMIFTGVFAGSLALLMTVLKMLDYPFEGAMRLSPAAFQVTLDHLRAMM